MKLTVLGSGTNFPTQRRFPSSFLLEEGGTKLLLDCGHSTLARLTELGLDPRELDGVFISHFHPDHFGDAFNVVVARFVGDVYEKKKPAKPLLFLGPPTLEERFKTWRTLFWPEPNDQYPLTFHEGVGKHRVGEIQIETFPVKHVPWFESVGIRVTVGGKVLVYPGDIGSSHNFSDLVKTARGADVLMIETGYPERTPNHWTLAQTAELVDAAGIKKVLLVHLRHTEDQEREAQAFVEQYPWAEIAEDKRVVEV